MAQKVDDDGDWQPPTAAELKVIEARRERSDKISKIMGDYLLKGFKMLGSTCGKCDTILLRTKQGVDYCIACNELGSDADKDDPALSIAAARTQAAEQTQRHDDAESSEDNWQLPDQHPPSQDSLEDAPSIPFPRSEAKRSSSSSCYTAPELKIPGRPASHPPSKQLRTQASGPYESLNKSDCSEVVIVLKDKIEWAAAELVKSPSVEYNIRLANLIKSSADAISALDAASVE